MSPLRRHIFVCFMAKISFLGFFFGFSSVKRGRIHIVRSLSFFVFFVCMYVCFFVCLSRYDARHRKPRQCVYALNLGGTAISPPDKSPPRAKDPPDKSTPGKKSTWPKVPPGKRPPGKKSPGQKTPGQKHPRTKIPQPRTPNKRRHILLQR